MFGYNDDDMRLQKGPRTIGKIKLKNLKIRLLISNDVLEIQEDASDDSVDDDLDADSEED
jgi:hypothetical protein